MLKNYFKIAFRNLKKYKGYSLINILGLAVGISVCVLIFQYVKHELSYDKYHEKSERIYRIELDHPQVHVALTPSMMLPALRQLFPEVEQGVRLYDPGRFQPLVVRYEDRVFEERNLVYADSSLFRVFDFEMLAGDPNTALSRPNTVVLTREMSQKYFGNQSPVGETVEINGRDFEVTGVIKEIPENSHFRFGFFASMVSRSGWSELSDDTWRAANFYTYVVLDEQARVEELKRKVDQHIAENFAENEFAASLDIFFKPLTEIHLYSEAESEIAPQGDIRYVWAASAIAILILLIACINYMNLATARSARRSREVGIRKVLGSDRRRLMAQFFGESAFFTLLAIGVGVLLIELFLPWFNNLVGQQLAVAYSSFQFWGMMLMLTVLVTLVAGSYPALVLSSFNPSAVLKGGQTKDGSSRLRKYLVVFQFAASIFLIISTMVIYRQIDFIQEKELGYKQDNVLVLTAYSGVERSFEALKSELEQLPGAEGAVLTSETPTSIRAGYGPDVEGIEEGPNFMSNALRVSPEFTDVMDVDVVAGRTFTEGDFKRANQREDYEYAMLVNEAAASYFGVDPEELVGRRASIGGGSGTIVGVVEDFHFSSLHKPIEPLFIFPRGSFNKLLISFNTDDIRQSLEATRALWRDMFPQYPFEYEFLDQEYEALYQQETRAGSIFYSFAILAIFIACLGLIGLASYMVERRTREIGVRKVLGASASHIMTLFSKDFILLVLLGFLVALPVSWYVMAEWLSAFAYKVSLSVDLFLLAALVTLVVALLTVSWQAVKAATMDPVKSLRSE